MGQFLQITINLMTSFFLSLKCRFCFIIVMWKKKFENIIGAKLDIFKLNKIHNSFPICYKNYEVICFPLYLWLGEKREVKKYVSLLGFWILELRIVSLTFIFMPYLSRRKSPKSILLKFWKTEQVFSSISSLYWSNNHHWFV
jgi:hypothetical protein